MSTTIQIKRRVGSAGTPASLAVGELAFHDPGGGPAELYIGTTPAAILTLVSNQRQVELAGAQTITGAKTIAPTNLKLTGGSSGNVLSTDGAGNLSWIAPAAGGGGGVTVSDTAPASPAQGALWWESSTGKLWMSYTDINSTQWVYIGGGGVASAPTAPPSGLTLLNTLVASNSATLNDTSSITSAYDSYEIELINVVPATNGTGLLLQLYVLGAYQSTNYYSQLTGSDNNAFRGEMRTDSIQLSSGNTSFNGTSSTGSGVSGNIILHAPNSATFKHVTGVTGWQSSGSDWASAICGGMYLGSGAVVTGLQFKFITGNITSGTIRIYGRKTS